MDGGGLKAVAELVQFGDIIKLGSVHKTSSPGKDTCDRVGRSGLALLMLSVVSSDGSVCSLSFDGSIRGEQDRCH